LAIALGFCVLGLDDRVAFGFTRRLGVAAANYDVLPLTRRCHARKLRL
jgi:hypothetical protein